MPRSDWNRGVPCTIDKRIYGTAIARTGLRRDDTRFPAEHRALAREAPVIPGDVAAFAEDAVARDDEANWILADRSADCARSFRRACARRKIGIGGEAAHRDGEQLLPNADFEVRADQHDSERLFLLPERGIKNSLRGWRGRRGIFDVARIRPTRAHVLERDALAARIGQRPSGPPP